MQPKTKLDCVYVDSMDGMHGYWMPRDMWFVPYMWLKKEDVKDVPVPFLVMTLHPDSELGFLTKDDDEFTNILELGRSFDDLDIEPDLRKDLRRVEKKNADVKLVYGKKEDFDRAAAWFLEVCKDETPEQFRRRRELWLENCYFVSAYLNDELIAFHIAWDLGDSIYYCGCWWNHEYRSMSPAIFLLKKDIERAIAAGKRSYDLGVGDERYKREWRPRRVPTKYYAKMSAEVAKSLQCEEFEPV